jgi:hypothetical protein
MSASPQLPTPAELEFAEFRKSSYSGAHNECVETAPLSSGVAVRDSKNPTGPVLVFPATAWHAFLAALDADVFGA